MTDYSRRPLGRCARPSGLPSLPRLAGSRRRRAALHGCGAPTAASRASRCCSRGVRRGRRHRVQSLYDHVAHDYDEVFAAARRRALPAQATGDRPLAAFAADACSTSAAAPALGAQIQRPAIDVVGVDLRRACWPSARERPGRRLRGLLVGAALRGRLFDLSLTVATLHHLETPLRVADTIAEMGRVVRRGGFVLIWDHNPLNPYWPILMKRVPQDTATSGWSRWGRSWPTSRRPACADSVRRLGPGAGLRAGRLMPLARGASGSSKRSSRSSLLAAHNVVVAQKP